MKAAKFAAKYELGSDLKLSPSALYLLSEDASWRGFTKKERERITAAVLEAAASERIEQERAQEIIDQILEEITAADAAKQEAFQAKQEADRARRLAWESKNPQPAKKKARERFIREAMREEMDEAKEKARAKGETWSEIKDEWVEKWLKDNWDPTREGEFEAYWADYWRDHHGPTAEETEEAEARETEEAEARETEEAEAKETEEAEAQETEEAEPAEAKANAEAEAEKARANASARFHYRRLLVKTLGMLGSDNAGVRDAAALAAEKQRVKLGMTWHQLIVSAREMRRPPDE
jgi:hypothetical protein